MFLDESHVMIGQLGGMYNGDRARKTTLVDYGFRLPSALDNRPLKFEEFEGKMRQVIFVSATPAAYEKDNAGQVVEQLVRPTGLVDPEVDVRPAANQVDDVLQEIRERVEAGERVLITTLTKRMAEQLTDYLSDNGVKVRYLHSDIDTVERVEILRDLRLGAFDVLVGINLLREGLDIPEVSLVAILDADKEGFLRSERSLIQTIGRAARNLNGTRDPLRRPDHRLDAARPRRDESPPGERQIAHNHGVGHHAAQRRQEDSRPDRRRLQREERQGRPEAGEPGGCGRGAQRARPGQAHQAARARDAGACAQPRIRESGPDPRPADGVAGAGVRRRGAGSGRRFGVERGLEKLRICPICRTGCHRAVSRSHA